MDKAEIVKLVFMVLVVAATQVIQMNLTSWPQLTDLRYWATVILEVGGIYGIYRVGVRQDPIR